MSLRVPRLAEAPSIDCWVLGHGRFDFIALDLFPVVVLSRRWSSKPWYYVI